jgi:hypothetical protein
MTGNTQKETLRYLSGPVGPIVPSAARLLRIRGPCRDPGVGLWADWDGWRNAGAQRDQPSGRRATIVQNRFTV